MHEKYLKVRSLYFIKGLNYEGAPFSLLANGQQRLTIFPEVRVSDIEPYAISARLGNGLLAVMSDGLPGQPQHKLTEEQFGQMMVEKCNGESGKGVFVQISNRLETNIELTSLEDKCNNLNSANFYPIPRISHDPGKYILYYENADRVTGFLQHELDQELSAIEKGDANCLAVFLIKSGNAFSARKLATALVIEANEMDVWLNHITLSMTTEETITLDDADSMVSHFHSGSELAENIDGLLLMQSLGYNTKTPYAQFMSLWVVLEKIINRSFKKLSKKRIFEVAKKTGSLLKKRTIAHLREVDNDSVRSVDKMKFNLADRLLVSTSAAGIELDDETISLFRQIKKTRDGLHSSICEDGYFPTKSIYKVLRALCG